MEFAAKLVARECIGFAVMDVTPGFTKSAARFLSARSRLLTTRTGFVRLVSRIGIVYIMLLLLCKYEDIIYVYKYYRINKL